MPQWTKIPARFTNADVARKHLESLLWANGRPCPHCGVLDQSTALKGKSTRPGVYWCNACQKPFSVTVGTVYEGSKIPLNVWLCQTHLLCSSKKGISSAHQLMPACWALAPTRPLGSWPTASARPWTPIPGSEPPLGGDGFVVEADEAYIGKKDGKRKHKGAGGYGHKRTVLSLVERGGKIKSFKLGSDTKHEIVAAIRATVDPASTLHTDGAPVYQIHANGRRP